MFIEPATVPAYFPPISMQAFHATGIERSVEKLAKAIAIIAKTGSPGARDQQGANS